MENDKTIAPFSLMALIVPAAEAASGKNWLPTLMLVLATCLICTWMSGRKAPQRKWLNWLRFFVLVMLLSWALEQTHYCWPGEQAELFVPAGLLLLAAYAVWRGSGLRAASVLRYGMYLVLASIGLLGISQLKLRELLPRADLPDMELAAILLLPLAARKTGKTGCNPVGVAAVLSSIITGGCVGLYQFSRSVALGGIGLRLESVAACAITVGNFALLCFLLDGMGAEEEGWRIWVGALAAFGLYLWKLPISPEFYVLALLILWVILPECCSLAEKVKIKKIRLDK